MSINDAMLAGVTGLIANSSALSAISDNIANSQTIGYKNTDVDFSTLITGASTAGATSAGGVMAVNSQDVVQQGQLQSSSSPTALAIQGNGFFCCTNTPFAPQSTTPVLFTRAGQFTQDKSGYLVNSAGLYLQGWPVDANGNVLSDPTNLTKLQPINVTAIAGAAEPTTSLTLQGNLQSSQAISTAGANGALPAMNGNPAVAATAGGYDPVANSMAAGGVTPDYTMQLPVSDSKGTKQEFDLDLLKSSVPNMWYAEIVANPPSSVTTGPGVPQGQVAAGMIAFTPDGQYDPVNSTPPFNSASPTITLGASNDPTAGTVAGQVNWAPSLGDAAQTISMNFGNSLTQFDSPSTVNNIQANGTAFGNLSGVEVGQNGQVTAVFDNGVTREIAVIPLATVPNPDGMTAEAGNAYSISNNSGTATLKTPDTGGAGYISANSLESSTVDLSTEFTNLIQTQQAYSAASKIITTANQMLTTLIQSIQ